MGCDIHLYAERKEKGVWIKAQECDINRNYNLFSILANVRNGNSLVPISELKGLPNDVSDGVRKESDGWDGDGHSHSYFTLQELLAYDWTQTATLRGVVHASTFDKWTRWGEKEGESPDSYCGGVYGFGVEIISRSELEKRLKKVTKGIDNYQLRDEAITKALPSVYCNLQWQIPYYRCASEFLSELIPQLLRLGKPENVCIVFWFDN